MRIKNNTTALNTHRMYSGNNAAISKSAEKLSSGYRVNRAGDDAAGLAISEKMRAQVRGLSMASKNSSDAISLVQTAEGALQEVHSMLQRMNELAVQAASDTNVTIDRDALQLEFSNLQEEIDQIAQTTKFNDTVLLEGIGSAGAAPTGKANFQAADQANTGLGLDAISITGAPVGTKVSIVTAAGVAGAPSATGKWSEDGSFTLTLSAADGEILTQEMVDKAIADADGAPAGAENFHIDMGMADIYCVADTVDGVTVGETTLSDKPLITFVDGMGVAEISDFSFNGGGVKHSITLTGPIGKTMRVITRVGNAPGTVIGIPQAYFETHIDGTNTPAYQPPNGVDMILVARLDPGSGYGAGSLNTAFSSANGNQVNAIDTKWFKAYMDAPIRYDTNTRSTDGWFDITFAAPKEEPPAVNTGLVIQVGAEAGHTLTINIDAMNTAGLGITKEAVKIAVAGGTAAESRTAASAAITATRDAINKVSTQRATLGAMQNRLEYKINNLDTTTENLQSAESRIRDTDMAKEMSEFTKNNILSQAATAMLAQANSLPQNVLQLLG